MALSRVMQVMNFINEFGFCELPQIQRQFGLTNSGTYKMMKGYIKEGLVKHERIFYHRHGIYRATRLGATLTCIPKLDKVPVGNYAHQIAVIETYMQFMKQYPGASWMTERVLRRLGYMPGKDRDKHYADALVYLPDGKQIAIEVELTMKSKRRLKKIMSGYMCQFEIKEVWYYCAPAIVNKVKQLADKWESVIKVYELTPDITDKIRSVSFVR